MYGAKMKIHGKLGRQERAVSLMEKHITEHEKSVEFTKRILEDKELLKDRSEEQVEKIRKKKLERIKTCLENTKGKMK